MSSSSSSRVEDTFDYPYCDDVEKYEKITRIGKGTFGEVFRAKHKQTKREVALKKILMEHESEGFPITAIREIKLLSSYKDENIVNLIEVCRSSAEVNGKAISYLVFDFCHHDLAGLIQEAHDKINSLANIKCIVKQLLEGLHKLHTNKIIHRDMKSSNILITKDGELKIADFGLARPYSENAQNRKYTNRVVTLWYRPPELLLGERNYACAVDLWGVGCIMCELFTREPLMQGRTEQEQLHFIVDHIGPITSEVWPKVEELPLFHKLQGALNIRSRGLLLAKLKLFTQNQNALNLLRKLLFLDPNKRIDANTALDDDFFWLWDEKQGDPPPAEKKALARSLSSITQSHFEFTTKHKRAQKPPAHQNNFIGQQMVNRGNSHRPMAHRPGPSNNDGQYRDHVY